MILRNDLIFKNVSIMYMLKEIKKLMKEENLTESEADFVYNKMYRMYDILIHANLPSEYAWKLAKEYQRNTIQELKG